MDWKPSRGMLVAGLGVIALLFHLAHGQLGLGGHALDNFAFNWVYDAVIIGGAVSCLVRGIRVKAERVPWLLLGLGLGFDAAGEVYYSLVFGSSGNPPSPSVADALYLLYYPTAYVALVLLMRERMAGFSPSTWLDGAIAALTATSVIAALLFDPIVHVATQGDAPAVATNLAYPIGDLILLAVVAGAFALCGWRPGRSWLLLGIGLAMTALADTFYVWASAKGSYVVGGVLDSLWVASALMIGTAAWQPAPRRRPRAVEGWRMLVIPGVFGFVALSVLVLAGVRHVNPLGLSLAALALVFVILRAGWTYRENLLLLAITRREAVTDALTGLGNRRLMTTDLDHVMAEVNGSRPAILIMFDLNGFKLYNDHFGHLAGDTLLAHLGRRLAASVSHAGRAYRIGGDEFCVLLTDDLANADIHAAAALAALAVSGEGFTVTASHGKVSLPLEAQTATTALRLADDRMYAEKGGGRASAGQQTHDVLLGLLRERQPDLHEHLRHVGELAVLVGRRLGMQGEALDELRRAAELHDIGKAAIPDAILAKPGPLNEDEWMFMRRHTLVGERILAAAPALAPVAQIVRSSHERWDGSGYPDGLSGEAIPLGARIVAVCDAFDAITTERPYAAAEGADAAIGELRSCGGTQFDARVIEAFAAAWAQARAAEADASPADVAASSLLR